MISFEKEIKDLLYSNNFLVLPDLGAFVAKFEQPGFDESITGIRGPAKSFDFNYLIREDLNSKFFGILSEKYYTSVDEIKNQYYDFLHHVNTQLDRNNKFIISDLGYFERDRSGNISFLINSAINFYDEPVSEKVRTPRKKINIDEIQQYDYKKNRDREEEKEENYGDVPQAKVRKMSPAFKFFLYLLPILVLIAGLVYILFLKKDPVAPKKNQSSIAEVFDSTKLEQPLPDSLMLTVDSLSPVSKTDTLLRKNEPVKELPLAPKEDNYMITVGIFRDQSNINQLKHQLKENGIVAQTEKMKTLTRVYVMSGSEEEAKKIVTKIEQLTGDKAVYNKIK